MPLPRNLHLHLDPVGGIAGDMFLAAAIDLRPELAEGALAAMRAAGLPESCRPAFSRAHDHGFQGRRFAVAEPPPGKDPRYPAIRAALDDSTLLPGVKRRALEIYRLLAEAEAEIHGTGIEEVHFHELAAWDTLADVVGAAFVIDSFQAVGWSVAPLPLGSGQVKTAHGLLPVPAPATAKLLEGFQVQDDGQPGERVTPTGAAILRHLMPAQRKPETPLRLCGQGFGFGTRQLADRPNCLRLLALAPLAGDAAALAEEEVAVVTFEVDDQTPEDLAIGLDNLRELEGVLDVVHAPVFGKKNRMGDPRPFAVPAGEPGGGHRRLLQRDHDHRPALAEARPGHPGAHPLPRRARRQGGQAAGRPADRQGGSRRPGAGVGRPRRAAGGGPHGGAQGPERHPGSGGDMNAPLRNPAGALARVLEEIGPAAVAVSGGVDSLTLGVALHRRFPAAARMFHAVSPAVPPEATRRVRDLAAAEGWNLTVMDAGEFADPDYLRNPVNRCFYCKTNLYRAMRQSIEGVLCSGTNLDDLGDFRPGLEAARSYEVRHPYVEAGIDKAGVRHLARDLGLGDLAELPAAPCLSSRVETGIAVEAGTLALIHEVETAARGWLEDRGVRPAALRFRVRRDVLALEIDAASLERLSAPDAATLQAQLTGLARAAGRNEPLVLEPYRRGSAFLQPAAGARRPA